MRNSCSELPSCHERITGEQPRSASAREVPAMGRGAEGAGRAGAGRAGPRAGLTGARVRGRIMLLPPPAAGHPSLCLLGRSTSGEKLPDSHGTETKMNETVSWLVVIDVFFSEKEASPSPPIGSAVWLTHALGQVLRERLPLAGLASSGISGQPGRAPAQPATRSSSPCSGGAGVPAAGSVCGSLR